MAAEALGPVKSEFVQRSLADALTNNTVEVQVAAGEALVRMKAEELYGGVAEAMLQVAQAHHTQDLRRRVGKVLSAIPGGVEPFHQPIQAELVRGEAEGALELIAATLEIFPEDVDLFWWRGYALRSLRRLDEAADSYQHAFELAQGVSVIPQALAQTFLELHDYPRAMEAARRGVELAPNDAEAQSILAWSSYKVGAIQDAVRAASKAVDLDPVHSDAIWIVLLGHIRQANVEESRSAFQHARKTLRLPRCLRRGGMSAVGSRLDACCQAELRRVQWRHGPPQNTACCLRYSLPLGLVAQVPARCVARRGATAGAGALCRYCGAV